MFLNLFMGPRIGKNIYTSSWCLPAAFLLAFLLLSWEQGIQAATDGRSTESDKASKLLHSIKIVTNFLLIEQSCSQSYKFPPTRWYCDFHCTSLHLQPKKRKKWEVYQTKLGLIKIREGNVLEFVFGPADRQKYIHQQLLLAGSLSYCFFATFMRARHSGSHRWPIDGEW